MPIWMNFYEIFLKYNLNQNFHFNMGPNGSDSGGLGSLGKRKTVIHCVSDDLELTLVVSSTNNNAIVRTMRNYDCLTMKKFCLCNFWKNVTMYQLYKIWGGITIQSSDKFLLFTIFTILYHSTNISISLNMCWQN